MKDSSGKERKKERKIIIEKKERKNGKQKRKRGNRWSIKKERKKER